MGTESHSLLLRLAFDTMGLHKVWAIVHLPERLHRIIGFASFTTDLGSLYKTVIRKSGARFFYNWQVRRFHGE